MKAILNRLLTSALVFVALVISLLIFPFTATYFIFTGKDVTGGWSKLLK